MFALRTYALALPRPGMMALKSVSYDSTNKFRMSFFQGLARLPSLATFFTSTTFNENYNKIPPMLHGFSRLVKSTWSSHYSSRIFTEFHELMLEEISDSNPSGCNYLAHMLLDQFIDSLRTHDCTACLVNDFQLCDTSSSSINEYNSVVINPYSITVPLSFLMRKSNNNVSLKDWLATWPPLVEKRRMSTRSMRSTAGAAVSLPQILIMHIQRYCNLSSVETNATTSSSSSTAYIPLQIRKDNTCLDIPLTVDIQGETYNLCMALVSIYLNLDDVEYVNSHENYK